MNGEVSIGVYYLMRFAAPQVNRPQSLQPVASGVSLTNTSPQRQQGTSHIRQNALSLAGATGW
jgi:hypothetical protein